MKDKKNVMTVGEFLVKINKKLEGLGMVVTLATKLREDMDKGKLEVRFFPKKD